MMRSMFSGISGLRIHQTKMDVIGNNIANVNTTAFKASRVTFNEVFSQTLQGASGASAQTGRGGRNPMQVGLGANIASVDTLMTTGAAQRTDNPFDLMINGDGFFVVGDESGTYFTRAGAFRKDDEGNLVIPNGMKVYGWNTVETDSNTGVQTVVRANVGPLKLDSPENLTASPAATTKIRLNGNINQIDGQSTNGISVQVQFYDSLGNLFNGILKATYDPTATPPTWSFVGTAKNDDGNEQLDVMEIISADGSYVGTVKIDIGSMQFDTSGKLALDSDGKPVLLQNVVIKGNSATLYKANDDTKTVINLNSTISSIEVSLEDLTQFTSKTNIDPIRVDGREPGELTGYNIGSDGIIIGQYSNGQQKMLGQVVIANFRNPAGLQKVGDNLFTTTPNSGEFDGIGEEPDLQGGVLEMSNVDLAKEFTEMITTQRGFQANSRIITSSDEMLQELVNLKR